MASSSNIGTSTDEMGSSSTTNQEKDFKLLDSLYAAALAGDIDKFTPHRPTIDQILTPNGNTILHIYITARSGRKKTSRENGGFVKGVIEMSPRLLWQTNNEGDGFVRGVLEMCPKLLWQTNNEGESLLHFAARYGKAHIVRFIIEECGREDPEHGSTKLMLEMLQVINKVKDTALHEAIRYGRLEVVEILTEWGPRVRYWANSAGETPLYMAAERGNTEIVERMLNICASSADSGPCGRTALHQAVIYNYKEIARLLLDKQRICSTRKQDQQGWTPLHLAAHFGYVEILKMLLNKDPDAAYMSDDVGKTALHVAAAAGKVRTMQELVSICPGCSELVDNSGRNALHFAASAIGSWKPFLNPPLRNLLNQKEDENGNTPFLEAVSAGNIKLSNIGLFRHEDMPIDEKVFNHENCNAADIIRAISSKSRLPTLLGEYYMWMQRRKYKVIPGMRTRISEGSRDKSKNTNTQTGEEEERTKEEVSRLQKILDNSMIAATLIATVSFGAGISIPGGLITDKGTAVLTGNTAFRDFVLFNTASFYLSSTAVCSHIIISWFTSARSRLSKLQEFGKLFGSQFLTIYAMMCMIAAFFFGSTAVLQARDKTAIYIVIGYVAFILIYLVYMARKFLNFQLKN